MKTEFVWVAEDEEFGTAGWRPSHMPNANAGDARLVAHDSIEHAIADTDGGFEGECQSSGAIIASRAETGRIGTAFHPDWRVHCASDLEVFIGERFGDERVDIKRCPYRVRVPREVTADMQVVFTMAKNGLVKSGMSARRIEQLRPHVIAWMRHGWRRMRSAARRANASMEEIGWLFDLVMAKCPKRGEYEGQRMVVDVSLRKVEVQIRVIDSFGEEEE